LAVALALTGLGARAQDDGGPRVLDRVVASVEAQVITASQLDFEARVLLVNAGGVTAATQPLDDETLASSLSALIDLRVATLEADKLDAYPVEPGDLDRAVEAFRARFRSEVLFREFLGRHEASLDDLRALLRRNLRAQRALDGKLRLKAQVTESEARVHLTRHPELAGTSVEVVRARLFAQRFNELVRDELAQARRQYSVRLLGPFAPRLPADRAP
jgi:hypothetical protein